MPIYFKDDAARIKHQAYMREYMKQYRKGRGPTANKGRALRLERLKYLVLLTPSGAACACCSRAPQNDAEWAGFDFHHLDPTTKLFTIAQGLTRSLSALEAEARKCVILCAFCHRVYPTYRV